MVCVQFSDNRVNGWLAAAAVLACIAAALADGEIVRVKQMFSLLSMSFADADRRPQTMSSLDLTDMQVAFLPAINSRTCTSL